MPDPLKYVHGGTDDQQTAKLEYLADRLNDLEGRLQDRSMTQDEARAIAREEAADISKRIVAELIPHLAEAISHSTDEGMRKALGDPQTWEKAVAAMKSQAQTHAGGWLLGGLSSIFSKVAWLCVIGMGVYLLGGWSALAAVAKAMFGHDQ